MPRQAVKELTAVAVERLTKPGYHRVGGVSGLCLQVKRSGARSWILRLTFAGRRSDFGLGSYPSITLAMARERARQMLDRQWSGADVLAERQAAKQVVAMVGTAPTFDECVRGFLADRVAVLKNQKARAQVENTLRTYAHPVIGQLPVDQVELQHLLAILKPIWTEKTETAIRVRGRIENVLSWASVHKLRAGPNPAAWRHNLDQVLPKPGKVRTVVHHAALPVAEVPGFVAALRARTEPAALALEFLILTAARSGEARGARWPEISLESGLWTVPGERMKMGRPHRVPLSGAAIALLKAAPRFAATDLVFPGRGMRPMSDLTLSSLPKRMGFQAVPHGFRSSFRDWAAERTDYPQEMAEMALAHDVGSAVERAYRRGDMLEKRRAMMDGWAGFLGA